MRNLNQRILRKIAPPVFGIISVFSCKHESRPISESTLESAAPGKTELVTGMNDFSLRLFDAVSSSEKFKGKNVFISPASVSTAFGMTYLGAKGDTAKELARVLNYPVGPDAIGGQFKSLLSALSASKEKDGFQLAIANRIWGQEKFGWLKKFTDQNLSVFNSKFGLVDFTKVSNHAAIVTDVNNWAAENTNDRIKNVLAVDNLTTDTRILLANAVYFLGDWQDQFVNPKGVDRKGPFKRLGVAPSVATYMTHGEPISAVRYFEDNNVQVLDLPYITKTTNHALVMTILLPKKEDGISAIEKSLKIADLNQLFSQMRELVSTGQDRVAVRLPKWEFSSDTINMTKIFTKNLGAELAFNSDKADFSGMTGGKDIALNLVLHKTFIKVDEKGTEAAAVTVIGGMRSTSVHIPMGKVIPFHADHPFLYYIRDTKTGTILFAGRMMDPAADK